MIGQRYPSAAAASRLPVTKLSDDGTAAARHFEREWFFFAIDDTSYFANLFSISFYPSTRPRSSPRSLQNTVVRIIVITLIQQHANCIYFIQNNRGYCLDFPNNLILLLYYCTAPRVTLIELFLSIILYEVTRHVCSVYSV